MRTERIVDAARRAVRAVKNHPNQPYSIPSHLRICNFISFESTALQSIFIFFSLFLFYLFLRARASFLFTLAGAAGRLLGMSTVRNFEGH